MFVGDHTTASASLAGAAAVVGTAAKPLGAPMRLKLHVYVELKYY